MAKSPFGFDRPEDSSGFLLWQTTMTWQRMIKKVLEHYPVSHAQFVILAVTLWFEKKGKDVSQTLIINHSRLDKMTVSKALKMLVAKSYAKRTENPQDTRAKSVCLTQKGRDIIERLIPVIEKIDKQFFRKLNRLDQTRLNSILRQLVMNE